MYWVLSVLLSGRGKYTRIKNGKIKGEQHMECIKNKDGINGCVNSSFTIYQNINGFRRSQCKNA